MKEMGELIVQASKVSLEAVPLLRSIGEESGRLNSLTEQIIAPPDSRLASATTCGVDR